MIPVRYNGHRLSTLGIISPWTKWPYFLADGIFKWIFFNKNDKIPIQISLKYVLRSTNDNKAGSGNGSGNGLVLSRRQAITWNTDDPVYWRVYAALGGDEFLISQNADQHIELCEKS